MPILSLSLLVVGSLVTVAEPIALKPSDTDPAITQFEGPHLIYRNEEAKKRGELLIFLPGTNGRPGGTNLFCQTAADLGYHVISLAYPTDIPATSVRNEAAETAFENFRVEIIEGRNLSDHVEVSRTNSIENRLIKALQYLDKNHKEEGWGQFVYGSGKLIWQKIAVSGHSQGGGHAGVIGAKHRVARVVMTGAPKDYSRASDSPAGWYRKTVTPASGFFAFNHVRDRQGCSYEEQILNLKALGVDKLGGPVMVDKEKPPFKHSRMLFTNFEGSPQESVQAHSTVIGDRITPKDKSGEPLFRAVWKYMLTEPVSGQK